MGTIRSLSSRHSSRFRQASLVVYGSEQYQAVRDLIDQGVYCGGSNGPLTFIARVLEAAYMADAVKSI